MPIAHAKKSAKSAAPMPKKSKSPSHAPSHAVAWIAVIAVVFSGCTLTLAAMAQTSYSVCNQNSIAGVRCLISQLSNKLDAINAKITSTCGQTPGTCAPSADYAVPNKAYAYPAPTPDATKCLQACEDEYNACAVKAGNDSQLLGACQPPLVACKAKFSP